MQQYKNLAYDKDYEDDYEENVVLSEMDSLAEILNTQELLEEWMMNTTLRDLDLASLNPNRGKTFETKNLMHLSEGSNKEINNIKIGSLEGTFIFFISFLFDATI